MLNGARSGHGRIRVTQVGAVRHCDSEAGPSARRVAARPGLRSDWGAATVAPARGSPPRTQIGAGFVDTGGGGGGSCPPDRIGLSDPKGAAVTLSAKACRTARPGPLTRRTRCAGMGKPAPGGCALRAPLPGRSARITGAPPGRQSEHPSIMTRMEPCMNLHPPAHRPPVAAGESSASALSQAFT